MGKGSIVVILQMGKLRLGRLGGLSGIVQGIRSLELNPALITKQVHF